MRLEQFISEGRFREIEFDTDNREEILVKMATLLFKECKPYLKDLGKSGKVMYRGARGSEMTKIVPRKDREPKNMDQDLSDEYDDNFESSFGWKPRSEGVFCSGDKQQAKGYGSGLFTVWPTGKYKFLWSDHVGDLYTYVDTTSSDSYIDTDWMYDDWKETYGEGGQGTWYYDGEDTGESDLLDASETVSGWIIRDHDFSSDDKDEEFDPMDEIDDDDFEWEPDIDSDSYVSDMADAERQRQWDERADIAHEYQDSDIQRAIQSGNEIMVGCKSYYLIDNEFTDELNDLLFIGKIKPIHKQLKFQFAYKKRRPTQKK